MATDSHALFAPCTVAGLPLLNRFAMAPMTRFYSPGGMPTRVNASYYRRRVEGGLGLIITEGAFIDHVVASHGESIPRFYGDDALDGWRFVADEVHGAGGRIFPQLWHVGAQRKRGEGYNPGVPAVSPSGLLGPGEPRGVAMTQHDIDAVIDGYASAAAAAHRIGCDGVELHAAHGYLIDQFFWAGTNSRTDRYGGDLVARTRFGCEVIQEIRRRVGPRFPVCLRFSQWKLPDYAARVAETPADLERFLGPLNDAGVSIYHCSVRRFWEPAFSGSDLPLSAWTKRLSGRPVITVGSVGLQQEFIPGVRRIAHPTGIERLIEWYERDAFDLAAVGRIVLSNPDWANKIRAGALSELRAFDPSLIRSYANPTVEHELT